MNSVVAPDHGERWIADTKVKGFGLRLWGNKSGGQKAFAIRVTDQNGNCLRASFKVKDPWILKSLLGSRYDRALGNYIEEARAWAREEIDRLKGHPNLRDSEKQRYQQAAEKIRMLSLEQAAVSILKGMRARKLSQAHIDRVDKLFHHYVPDYLKKQTLWEIKAADVVECLLANGISEGNIYVLRAFLSQIFEKAAFFDGRLGQFSKDFSKALLNRRPAAGAPDIHKAGEADFQRLFARLEQEDMRWQQALCIRLYFKYDLPISKLMAASWTKVIDGKMFPYCPGEYNSHYESWTKTEQQVVQRILGFLKRDFGVSQYWFPSPRGAAPGKQMTHIKRVDGMWRQALRDVGLNHHKLKVYRDAYRILIPVRSAWNFRPRPRSLRNVAELSKLMDEQPQFSSVHKEVR